jgi:hypothetical protein
MSDPSHIQDPHDADPDERLVKLWTNRFRRLIRDMPPGTVALVGHSGIDICNEKELREYEEQNSHRDNPPIMELIIHQGKFEPNSESM